MKKIFLLFILCFMFWITFAGKYDYDSKLVDKQFDKSDDVYLNTPANLPFQCDPSSEWYQYVIEDINIINWIITSKTSTWKLQTQCAINLATNARFVKYYAYSWDRKDIHKYVANFVVKYKWKKDISNQIVTDAIKFSISKFKYGCSFINQAWHYWIDKMSENNRNKYGDYYVDQIGSFIHNDPDFPVMDDLSRIWRWMDRLCPYPDSGLEFIKENAQEMSNDISSFGGTEEQEAEALSHAHSRWYVLFEERYAANPMFWPVSSTNNNSQTNQTTKPQKTCSSNQHLENKKCVSNKKSCSVSKGRWQKIWSWSTWGTCGVISCNSWYNMSSNKCVKWSTTSTTTKTTKWTLNFDNGNKYVWEIKDGLANGKGEMTYIDWSIYIWEWKNGQRHGEWTQTFPEWSEQYKWGWKNDLKDGQWKLVINTSTEFSVYVWGRIKWQKNWQWQMNYTDWSRYVWKWKNDKWNGIGTATMSDWTELSWVFDNGELQ